ncbi:MAG: hypothetical protein HFK04_02190 [Oscillospiraceae bacterium]|nr:hypothetical protein [Oscillospiraceae bacterium]
MKKTIAVLLLPAGSLAVSLGLALLNLYGIGFAAGRMPEWILLAVSVLFAAGAALAIWLLHRRFSARYGMKASAFFFLTLVPPLGLSGALFATVQILPSLTGIAAALLAISWGLTSAVFTAAGAMILGIMDAGKKQKS